MKHLSKFPCNYVALHPDNGRVKSFNMTNCKFDSTRMSHLDECKSFLNSARHRFFKKHIDAPVKYIRRHLKMQLSGYDNCYKIGPRFLNHLTVVCVTCHMKPTYRLL